ncbi:MAG: polysaccharide pyruvyl transferase family protein [Ruminococcaceae bacterium]|nr:polysaccharide pyruvyl transferase family protein [Oscillospiraceae bacterium]
MKFANYHFQARGVNNLGDNMQILAIDHIYEQMGIDLKDVVYIDTNELSTYKGEYVILPVTMPLVDYREGGIAGRFSPYIIPVFLGLTMVKETLEDVEVAYYKKYEPIGCRDERTLNTLRRYQIRCYLHGCITITLPKRESEPERGEVFLVDVDPKLAERIPASLRENAQIRTHLRHEKLEDAKAETLRQYQEYKDKARLVITSLLHCSMPCVAAGIPVILLKDRVSYRMSWLEKLLPINTPDKLEGTDWDPAPVELDAHRDRVLSLTIERLWKAYEENAPLCDLSWFYEDREKSEYINDACDSLKRWVDTHWTDRDAAYDYGLWGLTQIGEWLADYIAARYPNARLCHVYDSFRAAKFKGLRSVHPDVIRENPDEVVFVTTNGAEKAAKNLFEEMNKPEGSYAFLRLVL